VIIEQIEEKSTLDIQIENVDEIYNQKFQKYLNYCWIQKSIVQNVASRNFKSVRDQISHINHPIACIVIKNIDLDWDDFVEFCKLLYSSVTIHEQTRTNKKDLLHFLVSWVVYMEEKNISLVGPKHIPPSCWRLGPKREKQS
jgi:hypothetical protein